MVALPSPLGIFDEHSRVGKEAPKKKKNFNQSHFSEAKRFVDQNFMLKLLELFDSEALTGVFKGILKGSIRDL